MRKRILRGFILISFFISWTFLAFSLFAQNQPVNKNTDDKAQNLQLVIPPSQSQAQSFNVESIFSLDKIIAFLGFGSIIGLSFLRWGKTEKQK